MSHPAQPAYPLWLGDRLILLSPDNVIEAHAAVGAIRAQEMLRGDPPSAPLENVDKCLSIYQSRDEPRAHPEDLANAASSSIPDPHHSHHPVATLQPRLVAAAALAREPWNTTGISPGPRFVLLDKVGQLANGIRADAFADDPRLTTVTQLEAVLRDHINAIPGDNRPYEQWFEGVMRNQAGMEMADGNRLFDDWQQQLKAMTGESAAGDWLRRQQELKPHEADLSPASFAELGPLLGYLGAHERETLGRGEELAHWRRAVFQHAIGRIDDPAHRAYQDDRRRGALVRFRQLTPDSVRRHDDYASTFDAAWYLRSGSRTLRQRRQACKLCTL